MARRNLTRAQKLAGFGGKAAMRRAKGGGSKRSRKRSSRKRNPSRSFSAREHPRNADGTFRSKGRARSSRSKGRRSYRRNPPARGVVNMFMDGVVDAGEIVAGKVAVVSLPPALRLPTSGNTGLAVRLALAAALGWLADEFISPEIGRNILAGGLTVPLEELVAAANIPYVSAAVGTVGSYSHGPTVMRAPAPTTRRLAPGLGSYITSPPGSGVQLRN